MKGYSNEYLRTLEVVLLALLDDHPDRPIQAHNMEGNTTSYLPNEIRTLIRRACPHERVIGLGSDYWCVLCHQPLQRVIQDITIVYFPKGA